MPDRAHADREIRREVSPARPSLARQHSAIPKPNLNACGEQPHSAERSAMSNTTARSRRRTKKAAQPRGSLKTSIKPGAQPLIARQHTDCAKSTNSDCSEQPHGDVVAQGRNETQGRASRGIAELIIACRDYRSWLAARIKLELQAQAICRGRCAGDKKAGAKLWAAVQKGRSDDSLAAVVLEPFIADIKAWNKRLAPRRSALEKKATATGYWDLIPRGFGAFNLAFLIGEVGELASYRNPSCLWKRMGLAVIDGARQRKHTNKELADVHGYCPRRRALAYIIGDCLIRAKSPAADVYVKRKLEKIALGWTKLHAHRDAKMYMVKRVLRDLWIATQPSRSPLPTNAHGASHLNGNAAQPTEDPETMAAFGGQHLNGSAAQPRGVTQPTLVTGGQHPS